MFAAFEAAFERFEADVDGSELPMALTPTPTPTPAPAPTPALTLTPTPTLTLTPTLTRSELPMASLPWPPEDVPVSGVRRSDSDAARKARLEKSYLLACLLTY